MRTLLDGQRVLRVALRSLRRDPLFTIVVLISFVVGIAACTLVISVVEAAWYHPQVARDPSNVVVVRETTSIHCPSCFDAFSSATFERWRRARPRSFAALAAYEETAVAVENPFVDAPVPAVRVGPDFFKVLGIRPALGRPVDSLDCHGPTPNVALLGFGEWQQLFGGQRSAIGRSMRMDGQLYTVIGVLPRGFAFPQGAKIWFGCVDASLGADTPERRTLAAIGRLNANTSPRQARAELQSLTGWHTALTAGADDPRGVAVVSLERWTQDTVPRGHWLLVGAVCLALLVACANIASLYLVRTLRREREIAVRCAVGAGTSHIAAQLLIESLVLAVSGGAGGVLLAGQLLHVISTFATGYLGIPAALTLNTPMAAAAFGLAVTAGIAFGMAPMLHLRHADPALLLRSAASGLTARRDQRMARRALVVIEIVLVVSLSAGAVLFTRSYWNAQHVDLGFDASKIFVARMRFDTERPDIPGGMRRAVDDLSRHLSDLPVGTSVAIWAHHPILAKYSGDALREPVVTIEGRAPLYNKTSLPVVLEATPPVFSTLGIRLIQGRGFTNSDVESLAPVAVVNKEAAQYYWPGQDPIGKRLKLGPESSMGPWLTVIGVTEATGVPDVRGLALTLANPGRPWPVIYELMNDRPIRELTIAVRSPDMPERYARRIKLAIGSVFGRAARVQSGNMRDLTMSDWPLPTLELKSMLLAGFAVLSVVLGLLGIYAVVAESVHERTREIGIRVALGAPAVGVLRLVLGEALRLALLGIAGGLVFTALLIAAARRVIFGIVGGWKTGLLFGVSPTNPWLYLALSLSLLVLILLSGLIPARRALRIDPAQTLRDE